MSVCVCVCVCVFVFSWLNMCYSGLSLVKCVCASVDAACETDTHDRSIVNVFGEIQPETKVCVIKWFIKAARCDQI